MNVKFAGKLSDISNRCNYMLSVFMEMRNPSNVKFVSGVLDEEQILKNTLQWFTTNNIMCNLLQELWKIKIFEDTHDYSSQQGITI